MQQQRKRHQTVYGLRAMKVDGTMADIVRNFSLFWTILFLVLIDF